VNIVFILATVLSVLQFRLLGFALLSLAIAFRFVNFRFDSKWLRISVEVLFLLALFSPVDVALGGFDWGRRIGTSSGRPHLAPFVVGKPATGRLLQQHNEFIAAGCTWVTPLPPTWVLVWD